MRRLFIITTLIFVLAAGQVMAQDEAEPTAPPSTPTQQELYDLTVVEADRAAAAAATSEMALEQANQAVDTAFNVIGLFEMMAAAVGLVVPFLALVAGFIGFRRLENASSELREARERFEKDVQEKENKLDALRVELERTAREQRDTAAQASLALALLPLGERQYRAQDYAGALDTYHRALDLDKDNPIIHYRIGYVHTQSGELEKAEGHFIRSLELDSDFTPSRAARGYVYRRMGDKMPPGVERDIVYNKAEENFLDALKYSPKLIDEDNESWWGALGGLYRRRGQIDQAIEAYRRGTEVTPHSSYPFSNLALLYLQTQQREKALKAYERVEKLALGEIRADADNYWAYADLVVSRLALGKYQEVDDVLDTALDNAPEDSPYTLVILLETLERLRDAMQTEEQPPIQQVINHIQNFKTRRENRSTTPIASAE